jgi:hypothetical protein
MKVRVKKSANGNFSDLERGQIVGARLVWSICDKNSHITRRIESGSFKGYIGIHESWDDNISEEEQCTKFNTYRKRSSYNEKDCIKNSQNYCSTSDRTAEVNVNLEDPVSTKTVRRELHKSNTHGTAAIAKPLITGSNAQMRKRRCHDHKTWT